MLCLYHAPTRAGQGWLAPDIHNPVKTPSNPPISDGVPDAVSGLDTRFSLLAGLQSGGGENSWREFYTKYRHYILSMAGRMGLDADRCHDVLQMVMMVVIREACGFLYDPETRTFRNAAVVRDGETHAFVRFRSWLKGVVQIKVWEIRKFAARGGLPVPDGEEGAMERLPDPAPQPDEAADEASETAFRQSLLEQALVILRESYRGSGRNVEVFESIVLRGMTGAEAAETFGITEVHARQIVHTLKQKLKRILEDLMRGKTDS
ncbi:MAG: hypothetical protein JWM59_3363 [Verrucomicrobiales bacterium]|nr:hypothetical protein [Verrucomicrobiales bacterium]